MIICLPRQARGERGEENSTKKRRGFIAEFPSRSGADRERPHVVFGADGETPVAISTGYRDGPGDHTYTLVQETVLSEEEMARLY